MEGTETKLSLVNFRNGLLPKNITYFLIRERRKLAKLQPKVDSGIIPIDDLLQSYKSWKGEMRKFNSYRSLKRMDDLFYSLYGDYIYG